MYILIYFTFISKITFAHEFTLKKHPIQLYIYKAHTFNIAYFMSVNFGVYSEYN